ncbi:MAG: hypothetical protein MK128_10910, partial [Dehalococcoidia bacterium]|nr:hypothetical protein [Dehalococcoidia bacterium]
QGHQLGLPVVNVGEAAIKFCNLALSLSPLAFLTMHSPVHFGLEDIRVSEVALDRNAALLRVERTHLTEELERQRETMSTLEQGQAAVASLKALREHMCDRLDSATPEDRRTVLEALETRVTVGVDGLLEVSIGIPQQVADCVHRTHGQ